MEDKEEIEYFKLIKAINNIKDLKKENKKHLKLAKVFRNAFLLTSLSGFMLASVSAGVFKSKVLTIFTCALGGLALLGSGAMVWMNKRIQKSDKDCDEAMKIFKKIRREKFYYTDDEEDENIEQDNK